MLGIAAIIKAQGSASIYKEIIIHTTSISATWQAIVGNTGSPLTWSVSGGVVISEQEFTGNTAPSLDLSSNTGTAIISIKSYTDFVGLTEFRTNGEGGIADNITYINVTEATDIVVFGCKGHPNLASIDISTLSSLQSFAFRDNPSMTTLNTDNNPAIIEYYAYRDNLNDISLANNDNCTTVHVYDNNLSSTEIDQLLIDLDDNGQSGGTLLAYNNTGLPTSNSYNAYQGLLGKSWTITLDAIPPNPAPDPEFSLPVLSNFRVESTNTNRVLFDSSGDITGLSLTGFAIPGKSISSIFVNGAATTGHYFTVGTSFTFWDNTTIRLENSVYNVDDFTMEYIDNQIIEPTATVNRYVEVGASGDGTSIGSPASLSYAMSNAVAGQTWWVKAGNYGNVVCSPSNAGTVSNPIKFIGYKTTPGDITTNYYDGVGDISTAEMPTVTNGSRATNTYMWQVFTDYVIVKNFQVTNSDSGFKIQETVGFHGERLNVTDVGDSYDVGFSIYGPWADANQDIHDDTKARLVDCVAKNATGNNIGVVAAGVLVKDCISTSDEGVGDATLSTDYYIVFRGNYNISYNNYVYRQIDNAHTGYHGFKSENETLEAGYKSTTNPVPTEYGLMQNCTMQNIGRPLKARNSGTNYCVFKDNVVENTHFPASLSEEMFGVTIWGGIHHNVWERNKMTNVYAPFYIYKNIEDADYDLSRSMNNNIVRNNIAENYRMVFMFVSNNDGDACEFRDNKFYNNTVEDRATTAGGLVYVTSSTWNWTAGGNDVVGNILSDVYLIETTYNTRTGYTAFNWDYNNCYNWDVSYAPLGGTGNISVDPQYVDKLNEDFEPQNEALLVLPKITDIEQDFLKDKRGFTTTIGAVKHANELYSPVIEGTPVLSNFRVESANPDRVLFDSSSSISGMTKQGFIISGYLNSEITLTVNGVSTVGHYFTLNSALTYWDNNTIRLESGDGTVYDFTMEHIVNNISEPNIVNNTFYVDGSVPSSGAGTTEATAFKTIGEAHSAIISESTKEGSVVYIKAVAGGYTESFALNDYDGTPSAPIKFIGYKNSTGGVPEPIANNYYTAIHEASGLTDTEMPEIIYNSGSGLSYVLFTDRDYYIFKNIQFSTGGSSAHGFMVNSSVGVKFERCNFDDLASGGSLHGIYANVPADKITITDCVIKNAPDQNIQLNADYCLVENTSVYCDRESNDAASDYYFNTQGSYNIIKNNVAKRKDLTVLHAGHGFHVKASSGTYQYNLIVENEVYNIGSPMAARNQGALYNVYKRNLIVGLGKSEGNSNNGGGLQIWGGAKYNVFENNIVRDAYVGFQWSNNTEGNNVGIVTEENTFRNNVIYNVGYMLQAANSDTGNSTAYNNNYYYNNTIYNATYGFRFWAATAGYTKSGNQFKNNIFHTIPTLNYPTSAYDTSGISWDYNNFYSSFTPQGTNTSTVDPNFVSVVTPDFEPQATFTDIDAPKLSGVNYDYNEIERAATTTMGAIKHIDE